MGDGQNQHSATAESEDQLQSWQTLLARSQRLIEGMQQPVQSGENAAFSLLDPTIVGTVMVEVGQKLLAHPGRLVEAQAELMEDYARLWRATAAVLDGKPREPVIEPAKDDRRFKDAAWTNEPAFDAIKQYYLLTARWLESVVGNLELDPKTRAKALFYVRQFISAMAPTNFAATNPKVLRAAKETDGESLRSGFSRLIDELEQSNGRLRIPLTDVNAFRLGENLATTPGKVIFQNDLAQIIQYSPTTATVRRRPLLIVPPWINKFYILDMQPKNSFIQWAVSEGHTVFIISWVNPDERHVQKKFDDYLLEGPLAALNVIADVTGEKHVNAIGYCIGGTLLACTLAHLAAKGDDRIASATFFTTMMDFSDPGELGVFIDEAQLAHLERHMAVKGYLEGSYMAQVFNLLRENDLIWSAYVNNYLLAKDPPAFDLLFWNSDSTRMPAMMHSFYLREMYLHNRLIEKDRLTIAGTPIDLRRIAVPTYFLSTREDHIAPWRSTYAATCLLRGPIRFVLAGSGHIAGVVNPPKTGKYGYWTADSLPRSPEAWLVGAEHHEGSWWNDWSQWIGALDSDRVGARGPGDGGHAILENAPGTYVRVRADAG